MKESIASLLNLTPRSVSAVIELLADGNTIPFIARYRKEATGGLDEVQLRKIQKEFHRLQALDDRRAAILKAVQEQGKLTSDLEAALQAAQTRTELEDLYQPFKKKRKTRADRAREMGLQPLSDKILSQSGDSRPLKETAQKYISDQLPDQEDVWQGARDVAAEVISDHPRVRGETRQQALKSSKIRTEKKEAGEDPRGVYRAYYDFQIRINRLKSHQILALNRAEEEGVIKFNLNIPEQGWREAAARQFPIREDSPYAEQLQMAVDESGSRLLLPAIERDVRRNLTERAEDDAIRIFAKNLRALLMQPPLAGYTVMGLDPGFRTGCKVAVVDPTGKPLAVDTIYPVPPRSREEESRRVLNRLIKTHRVSLIAIGNGTASRETEQFVADLIADRDGLHYLIVSEAGASVYSASLLAGKELPDLDVSLRGAVSIARRVQDPLAELVKIDPQSIGVGMYQHDVSQQKLQEKLAEVVESVVNQVGVDLNTASPALLTYVSGIGPTLAERIVAYRDQQGAFQRRKELLEVSGLGPKTFQQAAGFLRISGGKDPLDGTAIHPESYPAARKVLQMAGIQVGSPPDQKMKSLQQLSREISAQDLVEELGIGVPTLMDIFKQLAAPGRDPREDLPKPILRRDVLQMEDLAEGMVLKGTVRNVVAFGAFIDIGVKQDGLLHRSKIPDGQSLQVGDIIKVEVLNIDPERGRIGLGWGQ